MNCKKEIKLSISLGVFIWGGFGTTSPACNSDFVFNSVKNIWLNTVSCDKDGLHAADNILLCSINAVTKSPPVSGVKL